MLNRLFSNLDINFLFNLFSRYKLGDDLTWIDLFGLRCYDLLKQIERFFSIPDEFTKQWCPVYLLGYVSLFYGANAKVEDGKFFRTPITFAKQLNTLSSDFEGAFSMLLHSCQRGRKKFKEKVEALIEDWKKTSRLFEKFLMLPDPSVLLCDQTVSGCIGASQMIPSTKEERKQSIDHLIMYMQLHEEAFSWGTKNGTLTISLPFSELIKRVHCLRNQWVSSSQEALFAKGYEFLEDLSFWKGAIYRGIQSSERDLEEAGSGRFTHSQWRERHKFSSLEEPLAQPDFIERVTQSVMLGKLLFGLSSDYRGIVESCILQSSDHNSVARANRLKHVAGCILESSFAGEEELLEIRNRFKEKLSAVCSLSYIKEFLEIPELNHNSLVVFDCKEIYEAFLKLQEEADLFLACISSEKMEAFSLSEDELNFWAQVFVLLHDLKILTQHGLVSIHESEIFPSAFLELFESLEEEQYEPGEEEKLSPQELEDLPSIVQLDLVSSPALSSEKAEEEPNFSSEPISKLARLAVEKTSQAEATLSKSARKKQRKKQEREKKEKAKEVLVEREKRKVEQMLQDPAASSAIPEKLREILVEKKRLKVERILRSLGLEPLATKHRGKGDHEIWRDPQNRWGQTVIPHHDEIAEGTRHAIVDQLLNKE